MTPHGPRDALLRRGLALEYATLGWNVGWWWADPAAGLVLVGYAVRETHATFTGS